MAASPPSISETSPTSSGRKIPPASYVNDDGRETCSTSCINSCLHLIKVSRFLHVVAPAAHAAHTNSGAQRAVPAAVPCF